MSTESAVRRLLDYEEIRQIVARYAFSIDTRDLDALVGLFVEDVAVGRSRSGRPALREYFAAGLAPLGMSILSVTTHVIDLIDDDSATGEVYCTGEIERDGHVLRQAILYRDRYRRTDEGWRFVERDHLLWYSAPQADNPRDLPPANWPRGHVGRGTVPECFDSFQRFLAENQADDQG
jgi:ketosteroid isomerase-like protein